MKVGVLGSGDVAKVLADGFLKHGHDVMMGTRTPAKLTEWAKQNPKGHVGSFADAAKFADLAVLAVKGTAAVDALRAAGGANLVGKVVIDATNPIADSPPTNGVLKFFTSLDESLMNVCSGSFPMRASSRRSIRSAVPTWSILSSKVASRPSSFAETMTRQSES
jgi:hypothetical protein